ncbi:MAG: RNA polymerase sigma factor (sigma-70 family) [Verrucomicrobiales bacterium]|jgi:RNA polymerase sigma factor (sigma-70 family)
MMLAALEIDPTQPATDADTSSAPALVPVSDDAAAEIQLETIIREHASAVRDILIPRYRGGLTPSDIDDVVATASHRLWKHRSEFSKLRSPRAWFVRIADNVARDVLRYGWQKARQLEIAAEKSYLESFPPPPDTPEAPEIDPYLVEKIRTAVEALPENQRKIIWADALCSDGNIAAEDLARELGIPPGTVRVYRKRALDKLRKLLTEQGLDPNPKP